MTSFLEFVFWFVLALVTMLVLMPMSVFVTVKMGRMGWLLAERHFRLRYPEEGK